MAKAKTEAVKPMMGAGTQEENLPHPEVATTDTEIVKTVEEADEIIAEVVASTPLAPTPAPTPQLAQRGPQKPTLGRIVIFKLSEQNATEINRRRTTPHSIAERVKLNWQNQVMWPLGAQAHIGTEVKAGDEFPATVVKVYELEATEDEHDINLQVLLDGSDNYWARSVVEGDGEGQWHWPVRG